MCASFWNGFIDFILKGKSFLDCLNLFSPNDYDKNDKMIIISSITKTIKNLYCFVCGKYRKSEKPKLSCILEKTLVLSIIFSNCKNEDEKLFKEEELIEILKNLRLIKNI